MSILIWSTKFSTGIPDLDKEHREIIDSFNLLMGLMEQHKDGHYFKDVFVFLDSYVNYHFAHEEAIQREHVYPSYGEHKAIHDDFITWATQMRIEFDGGSLNYTSMMNAMLLVKEWLVHHITTEDQKLAIYLVSISREGSEHHE